MYGQSVKMYGQSVTECQLMYGMSSKFRREELGFFQFMI